MNAQEQVLRYEKALAAKDKLESLIATLKENAMTAILLEDVEQVTSPNGYIYKVAQGPVSRQFTSAAYQLLTPQVVAEFFTPTPKITIKGLEAAVKADAITKEMKHTILSSDRFCEVVEGELTLKRTTDKTFFDDMKGVPQ